MAQQQSRCTAHADRGEGVRAGASMTVLGARKWEVQRCNPTRLRRSARRVGSRRRHSAVDRRHAHVRCTTSRYACSHTVTVPFQVGISAAEGAASTSVTEILASDADFYGLLGIRPNVTNLGRPNVTIDLSALRRPPDRGVYLKDHLYAAETGRGAEGAASTSVTEILRRMDFHV